LKTYVSIPNQPKMSLIQNPEKTFRWGQVQCLMDKTTDKQLLLYLMGGRATYCCYEYYWTRSKQKAFTDWLEYMEKCIEMANKYGENVSWDKDEEEEVHCIDCDYTIEKNRFDRGGGRIMFTDVVGEYRCGVCDDRCSDPDGMFPDSETDDGNWVEPTEFEEFTYHGTTFWKNTDGKCQWFYEYNNGEVGDELGIYTSDDDLEFSDGEGKNAGDYVPVLYWGRLVGENLVLHGKGFGYNTKFGVHPVAKLIKRLRIRPMIATADSRAHEIIAHRAKYGNAPLFENNIVFGNFFSREQFAEECSGKASDYFDEFQEHIHELGRQGHFNELMKEYFEEWLETNQ
jgi:hypothetical protein